MYFWTKKNIASRELEIKIRDQLGVEQQLVTPKEISDLEPNLKKFYDGGVFYPNARHTINPRKVLLKLFDLFLKKGGKFKKTNVENIVFNGDTPIIKTINDNIIFDKVIVACGAFSKKLTDNLNEKIPLDTERGYHVHFKNCTSKKMMHTAKYMHQILDLALPAYDELFDEIDLDGLVKKKLHNVFLDQKKYSK